MLYAYFKDASYSFLKLNMKERAASCLEARGDWEAAARKMTFLISMIPEVVLNTDCRLVLRKGKTREGCRFI
jgi:hypothetical protein